MLSSLLLLGALLAPATQDAPELDWRTDLDASLQVAERDGRPLLLVFR